MCVCVSLCTTVVHNTAQYSSDNLPSYHPDNHHCSDVVHWRTAEVHGLAPAYLADELHVMVNSDTHQYLRSVASSSLIVSHTRLSSVDDRTFRLLLLVPEVVISAPSPPTFRARLKTRFFSLTRQSEHLTVHSAAKAFNR